MQDAPEPWTYTKCPCGHRACNQYTLSNQGVQGFSESDAQLMAAAPVILAALKGCVETGLVEYGNHYFDAAQAAIALAEGGQ
jgi:hypothetical protein